MSSISKRQQMCSMCQSQPQDMLILSCRHNLCLDCATQVYHLNSKNDHIICQICLTQTSLDQDTIVCLRSLSVKNNIKQNNIANNNYLPQGYDMQHSQYMMKQNYPPVPNKSHHKQSPPYQQQLALIQEEYTTMLKCERHNQPLTYYCLECNFYKICSQCMLLDNHRYHKVVTLKKASIQIKQTIQKVGREKLKLKTLLQKDKESLSMRKEQSQKQLQMNLVELKDVFDEMIKVIGRKYEELKKQIEQQAERKLQIMEGAINEIAKKITLIEETVQFEDELIKSSLEQQGRGMLQMFEYYESEMTRNPIDFEPSLPNFISEISPEMLLNKDRIFAELEHLLSDLVIGAEQDHNENSEENINLISHIGNDNFNPASHNDQKQKRSQYSMKKRHQQQNIPTANQIPYRKQISQNINIIQLGPQLSIREKKITTNSQIKRSKQSIQAIKRKARQNMKDREISHSRKMELSRSIENATDILNKIQERSQKN